MNTQKKHWIIYSSQPGTTWSCHSIYVLRDRAKTCGSAVDVYLRQFGKFPGTKYIARLEYPRTAKNS